MLMPSGKTIFENASSRDYYIRMGELKNKKTSGCIFLSYEDFDEAVIFLGGEPVTAMHEAKRWLTVGGELLEPVENKAITNSGRMSAYELPEGLLHIFIKRSKTRLPIIIIFVANAPLNSFSEMFEFLARRRRKSSK